MKLIHNFSKLFTAKLSKPNMFSTLAYDRMSLSFSHLMQLFTSLTAHRNTAPYTVFRESVAGIGGLVGGEVCAYPVVPGDHDAYREGRDELVEVHAKELGGVTPSVLSTSLRGSNFVLGSVARLSFVVDRTDGWLQTAYGCKGWCHTRKG